MYCNSYCLTGYGYAIIQPMATVNFAWILYTSAALLELGLLTFKPGRLTRVAIGVFALLLLSSSHTILLLNKPVIFGKSMFNFAEIAKNALQDGCAIEVNDIKECFNQIDYLFMHNDKYLELKNNCSSFILRYQGSDYPIH